MKSRRKTTIKFIRESIILIAFACSVVMSACEADQTQNQEDFVQAIASLGVTFSLSGDQLDIVINQQKALEDIPVMQKLGVINPDITQTSINMMPVRHAIADIGLAATTNILSYIFQNTYLYQLHIETYVTYIDDYGHYIKAPCYSFDFNRDLYNRINWNNFGGDNLIRIAPNINFSKWCINTLNAEQYRNSHW